MKDNERIKDARSTGRKRLRAALLKLVEEGELEYVCKHCGHIPSIPWTEKSRSGDFLDANHINGNWLDCDPVNGEFLCRPCHLKYDRHTKIEIQRTTGFDDYGYGVQ